MFAMLRTAGLILILLTTLTLAATDRNLPDRLEMLDGSSLRGLILRNSPHDVLIQTEKSEVLVPKSKIRRIHDAPDDNVFYADITRRGDLPSWRSIVHDLRTHDSIKSFEMIPATTIDNGLLRNIPYLSFRVNELDELNVYGNTDNPAAIEFGIYGRGRLTEQKRRVFREFIAGHLDTREEIAALYSLGRDQREARAGQLAFRLISPDDPDGYGGWWIVVYHPGRMEKARVSDREYAKVTLPFDQVNRRDGRLRRDDTQSNIEWLGQKMQNLTGQIPALRGFYRDKDGVFRVIGFDEES